MDSGFSKNYFELFGLPMAYSLDAARLSAAYREIQSQVHPDRFVAAAEAERRRSMQWATFANEAYRTLKEPLARARYLVKLNGVDTEEETNTSMPAEFLLQQMEWREAVAEAAHDGDEVALGRLASQLDEVRTDFHASLATLLDADFDYQAAAQVVRKLRFVETLQEEIDDALEAINP